MTCSLECGVAVKTSIESSSDPLPPVSIPVTNALVTKQVSVGQFHSKRISAITGTVPSDILDEDPRSI